MDTLSRIIRSAIARGFGWRIGAAIAVVLLSWLGLGTKAHAYGTVSAGVGTIHGFWSGNVPETSSPTPASLCTLVGNMYAGNYVNAGYVFQPRPGSGADCVGIRAGDPSYANPTFAIIPHDYQGSACPANSSGATTCTCASGFQPSSDGSSCSSATSCNTVAAANTALGATFQGGTFKSLRFCNGGCVLEATTGYGMGTEWNLTGTFTATGQNCNTSGTGSDVTGKPNPLPAGKCSGTVNGLTVIVACDTTVSKATENVQQTATPASGPTGVISNTDKTTTVTCEGGRCATSTTSTTSLPDGSSSSSSTQKQDPLPQDSFCKENPSATICKASSISAACAGGSASFSCDGDAIQCEIAREQLRRQCEFFDKTGDETNAAATAKSDGTGGSSDHPARNPTSSTIAFDQTDVIGAGCVADKTIMVSGKPVVIELSRLCAPAAWLANLLVGITALACVGIVFKG